MQTTQLQALGVTSLLNSINTMSIYYYFIAIISGLYEGYWILSGDCKLSCLDSLFVGSKAMVSLSLAELPGNDRHLVLAMGGLDNKVHLYCGERTGKVSNFKIYVLPSDSCVGFFFSNGI